MSTNPKGQNPDNNSSGRGNKLPRNTSGVINPKNSRGNKQAINTSGVINQKNSSRTVSSKKTSPSDDQSPNQYENEDISSSQSQINTTLTATPESALLTDRIPLSKTKRGNSLFTRSVRNDSNDPDESEDEKEDDTRKRNQEENRLQRLIKRPSLRPAFNTEEEKKMNTANLKWVDADLFEKIGNVDSTKYNMDLDSVSKIKRNEIFRDPRGLLVIQETDADVLYGQFVDGSGPKYTVQELQLIMNSISLSKRRQLMDDEQLRVKLGELGVENIPKVTYQNLWNKFVNPEWVSEHITGRKDISVGVDRARLSALSKWTDKAGDLALEDMEYDTVRHILENLTWHDSYHEQARVNHQQLIGVEIEMNNTLLVYERLDGKVNQNGLFRQFALRRGHKPLMRHPELDIELHLDSLEKGVSVKLELVINPPVPTSELENKLKEIHEKLFLYHGQEAKHWIEQFEWVPDDDLGPEVRTYIRENLQGSTTLASAGIQATTTLRPAHLLSSIHSRDVKLTASGYRRGPEPLLNWIDQTATNYDVNNGGKGKVEDQKRWFNTLDENTAQQIVEENILKKIPMGYQHESGKGTGDLMKNFIEQFERNSGGSWPVAVDYYDRLDLEDGVDARGKPVYGPMTTRLRAHSRTYANKPGPVIKDGSGNVRYLIELRHPLFSENIKEILDKGRDNNQGVNGLKGRLKPYLDENGPKYAK